MDDRTREEHIAMMHDPNSWPQWPFLPLTKSEGLNDPNFELGLLVGDRGPTVHLTNLYAMDLDACEKRQFPSYENIYDSGWRVN